MDLMSAITRPLERSGGHRPERVRGARCGGLETGAVPSPFQIVESTPMYKLRRYFPPDNRPGRPPAGPAGADGAPDDDVGEHVGRHPRGRRRRHPARRRSGHLGHRLRLARRGRGRHGTHPDRPHRRAEPGHRHRQGRPPASDVHLAGYSQGGMFCYQTAAFRRSKDVASIVAFGSPVDTLAASARWAAGQHGRSVPPTSWPTTCSTGSTSRAGWPAPVSRCSTRSRRPSPGSSSCCSCTTAKPCCRANSSAASSTAKAGSPGPVRRSSELLKQFVTHNRMMTGGFAIQGQLVTLSDITCPVLAFVGEVDDIGQPRVGARHQAGRPQCRRLRGDDPRRPFRPGRRIQGRHQHLAHRGRLGAVGVRPRTPAGEHRA